MTIGGGVSRTDDQKVGLTEDGDTVVVIKDADGNPVEVTPGSPDNEGYGPTVHDPMMEMISIQLDHILGELKTMNKHLNEASELDL